jgi:Cation transporter/ATPase, N-terminus
MKINSLSRDDALRALGSSENGLTQAEAAKRLGENGFNEIRETYRPNFAVRFLKQFTHFLALLLWIGAGLSFLSAYLHPGEGMSTLGFAIIGVIVINAVFTFFQEYRAEKAFAELKKLLPFDVTVMREGRDPRAGTRSRRYHPSCRRRTDTRRCPTHRDAFPQDQQCRSYRRIGSSAQGSRSRAGRTSWECKHCLCGYDRSERLRQGPCFCDGDEHGIRAHSASYQRC